MQESILLDHVSLGVANLERSRAFYDATLRPLGLVRLLDFEGRGSDYGSVPHPHGVEFTITAESGTGTRAAPISASERPIEPLCAPSMPPRSRLAGWTMARPGCGPSIIPATTPRSCSIPMDIASKPCATRRMRSIDPI